MFHRFAFGHRGQSIAKFMHFLNSEHVANSLSLSSSSSCDAPRWSFGRRSKLMQQMILKQICIRDLFAFAIIYCWRIVSSCAMQCDEFNIQFRYVQFRERKSEITFSHIRKRVMWASIMSSIERIPIHGPHITINEITSRPITCRPSAIMLLNTMDAVQMQIWAEITTFHSKNLLQIYRRRRHHWLLRNGKRVKLNGSRMNKKTRDFVWMRWFGSSFVCSQNLLLLFNDSERLGDLDMICSCVWGVGVRVYGALISRISERYHFQKANIRVFDVISISVNQSPTFIKPHVYYIRPPHHMPCIRFSEWNAIGLRYASRLHAVSVVGGQRWHVSWFRFQKNKNVIPQFDSAHTHTTNAFADSRCIGRVWWQDGITER